jgi:hypothetical protein
MTKGTYSYNHLIEFCNNYDIKLLKNYENIFVTRDTIILGKCLDCDNSFEKNFRQVRKYFSPYCTNCTKIHAKEKRENSCIKKFGVKSYMQTSEFKDISKEVIKEKYGVENISQAQEIKDKKIETCMKNHGYEISFKSPEIREKIKQTFTNNYGVDNPLKSEEIKNRIKETNINKYGFENPQKNYEIKIKTMGSCFKKYGVSNILKLEEVINKRKQVCLEKYGSIYPIQTDLGKEQIKKTCLEKYGVENPQQCPEIADKTAKNSYYKKTYTFPSGKQINCQGYEPFALDYLLEKENIDENDIVTGCKNVPKIFYNDENGKKHRHYVDIFIQSQNRCIEVKSTWTAKKKKDNIYLKKEAGEKLGYKYDLWIFDQKGNFHNELIN